MNHRQSLRKAGQRFTAAVRFGRDFSIVAFGTKVPCAVPRQATHYAKFPPAFSEVEKLDPLTTRGSSTASG